MEATTMAFGPNDSRIKVTKSLEDEIHEATNVEQLKEILKAEALRTNLIVQDTMNRSVVHEVEPGTPHRFAKTIDVGGIKKTFEADSELDLEREVNEFFKETFSQPATEAQTEQPRNERGQFTADQAKSNEADAIRKAELELAFKRGDLSASDYLEKSGAIDAFMTERGIDLQSLQEVSLTSLERAWSNATAEFRSAHPEWDDFASGDSLRKIGETLVGMGCAEKIEYASAENLEIAYKHLVETGQLNKSPEAQATEKIQTATSADEIRDAVGYRGTTSLWGR
jgi:hypothetical protein